LPALSKPPTPYKPSIGDLTAFAFCAWLAYVFGSELWNAGAGGVLRAIADMPGSIARVVGELAVDLVWLVFLVGPILIILAVDGRLERRWSENWTKPTRGLALYRLAAWSIFVGGLILAGLYGTASSADSLEIIIAVNRRLRRPSEASARVNRPRRDSVKEDASMNPNIRPRRRSRASARNTDATRKPKPMR
jgi:hypothetical protein